MADVEVRDILLRCGGRTLHRTGFLAAMGAGRGYVEVKETFTRADVTPCATFVDRDVGAGQILRLAEAGRVRIEYPPTLSGLVDAFGYPYCGPLLEGAVANRARRQSELSNAFWTKGGVTITDNVGQKANGTALADKLVEDTNNTIHGISRTFNLTAADKIAVSAVVENAGRADIRMYFRSDAELNGFRGRFNLATGTYTPETAQGTGSITGGGVILLRSGKYRVWLSGTVDPAATTAVWRLLGNNPAGTDTYLGDGASGQIVSDIQVETGAVNAASSIIVNDGDTDITRAADSFSLPFNWGTNADITVLVRMARPLHADLSGSLSGPPIIWTFATANPHLQGNFGTASRVLVARIFDPSDINPGSPAIPAGTQVQLLGQFKTLTTGGKVALDVGTGLTAFSGVTGAPLAALANQTLRIGRGTGSGDEVYGVILDLIVARGLRTLAEMNAIP